MSQDIRLRVGENGRVAIPAAVRRALGVEIGDEIILEQENGEFRITTQQRRIERARRRIRQYIKPGTPVVEEFLADRRKAARRE
jgi:AbrB family looped-hinge helix DNA binding protein